MKSENLRHLIYAIILLLVGSLDYIYRNAFSSLYHPTVSLVLIILVVAVLLYISHICFFKPNQKISEEINQYYKDMIDEMTVSLENNTDLTPKHKVNSLKELISLYDSAQKQQKELVCKLTNTNQILDQNNRFAKAIMQITSEILNSRDIHGILQLILNKAIEIIPNAQKGSILLYNKDFLEYKAMVGYDMEALKGFRFRFNEIFQAHTNDIYEPIIITDVENFNKNLKSDKFNLLKDTRSFELSSCISCAIAIDNQFYGTINIDNTESNFAFSDEHKPIIKHFAEQIGVALKNAQLLEKILYLSQYDSLTNIYNRAYFEEELRMFHKEHEQSSKSYTLVVFDMNDLKLINDSYGHQAGDKLIVTFTDYVSKIEQKPEIIGRIGGDEFAMVYSNKSEQQVAEIMLGIRNHFDTSPFRYNDTDLLNISFGFGTCTFPLEETEISAVLRKADLKMYEDKRCHKSTTNKISNLPS